MLIPHVKYIRSDASRSVWLALLSELCIVLTSKLSTPVSHNSTGNKPIDTGCSGLQPLNCVASMPATSTPMAIIWKMRCRARALFWHGHSSMVPRRPKLSDQGFHDDEDVMASYAANAEKCFQHQCDVFVIKSASFLCRRGFLVSVVTVHLERHISLCTFPACRTRRLSPLSQDITYQNRARVIYHIGSLSFSRQDMTLTLHSPLSTFFRRPVLN